MKHFKNIFPAFILTTVFCFITLLASSAAGQTYRAPMDFDGDGKTDIAIYRPSSGEWWIQKSSDGTNYVLTFGVATDRIVPADYTGDGKCDIAVWRPSSGEWFILRSEDFSYYSVPFGMSTDIPQPADFDGDGKADLVVFRPSLGVWYLSYTVGGYDVIPFGLAGDIPVVGDYDGDGKADFTVRRNTEWYSRRSSNFTNYSFTFGSNNPSGETVFMGGDYTGDGKHDPAVYAPVNNNAWMYRRSENGSITGGNDYPDLVKVPGDYDGDHKIDMAVFNPANGLWTIYKSSGGQMFAIFGTVGDKPVPNAFVRKVTE